MAIQFTQTENEATGGSAEKFCTWTIYAAADTYVRGSTFTIGWPTLKAYYGGANSSYKNGGFCRVPIALTENNTVLFTKPEVYTAGTTSSNATGVNWLPSSTQEKELTRRNTSAGSSSVTTSRNTSTYFNSNNPYANTVTTNFKWVGYNMSSYQYSGTAEATEFLQTYQYNANGNKYVNRYLRTTDKKTFDIGGTVILRYSVSPSLAVTGVSSSYSYGSSVSVTASSTAYYGGYCSRIQCVVTDSSYQDVSTKNIAVSGTSSTGSGTVTFDDLDPGTYTLQVTATDSRGMTNYSSRTFTINEVQPPEIYSYDYVPSGKTSYQLGDDIKITVTAYADTSASISQIAVSLGGLTQYITNSTSGTVTFSNFQQTGTFTPTIIATDNKGQTASATMTSCTVIAQKNPTLEVISYPQAGTYDAGTTYPVTFANAQAYYGQTIQSIVLYIGTATATAPSGTTSGTLHVALPASGIYTPRIVITDSDNKSTPYELPEITIRNNAIYVSNVSAMRISKETATMDLPDDSGEGGLLMATFYVQADTLRPPEIHVDNEVSARAATWYRNYSTTTGFSNSIADSAAWEALPSGTTAYAKVSGTFNKNITYTFALTPIATKQSGTTIRVFLPQDFYLFAGRRGGKALGIGQKPSADNLFEVVMPTSFLCGIDNFTIKGNDNQMHPLVDFIYPIGAYFETSKTQQEFDPNNVWGGTWTLTAIPGTNKWHRSQ